MFIITNIAVGIIVDVVINIVIMIMVVITHVGIVVFNSMIIIIRNLKV